MRILALLLLTACPGRLGDPDVYLDATRAFPCDRTKEETFEQIVRPRCLTSGCHDSQSQASGLDLESPDTYARLHGTPALCADQALLDVGVPFAGYVFDKLTLTKPACGAPMPVTGPRLTAEELRCFHVWLTP